jgi:hypothetical protein
MDQHDKHDGAGGWPDGADAGDDAPYRCVHLDLFLPKGGRVVTPELHIVGKRACATAPNLAPQIYTALEELLSQHARQIAREFDDGVLLVTARRAGKGLWQLLIHHEDLPQLPQECQQLVAEWLADQKRVDARKEVEGN